MIQNGHSAESAIQILYDTYGRTSCVTKIINDLRRDEQKQMQPQRQQQQEDDRDGDETDSCEKTL